VAQEILGTPDEAAKLGRAKRRYGLLAEGQNDDALLVGAAIDDVDVELVVHEPGVVDPGGQPDLHVGMTREKAGQSRRQPLRGKAWCAMDAQHLRAPARDPVHAATDVFESRSHMPHQRVAVGAETHSPSLPLEQQRAEALFELADRMTDRARGEAQLRGRVME
jgi:hypothetical protein